MLDLRRLVRRDARPPVRSLLVEAQAGEEERGQGTFEVLVRHLFGRLLTSESLGLGEDGGVRVAQIAYAVALPGLVGALFLFPLYHSPLGPRPWWSQVGDHFLYVTYGFAAMGLGAVLQWDLLFPDLLDALILTGMPVSGRKLLLARAAALSLFLGGVLLGTNFLGILMLPYASELRGLGWRQVGSHAAAVIMGGLCVSAALVALQGLLVCALGQRLARRVSPLVQAVCVVGLLNILFLAPLVSQSLEALLTSGGPAVRWFPPFWFLGVYERLLRGSSARPVFDRLAWTGLWATVLTTAVAGATYPLAYGRRTRQVLEGNALRGRTPWIHATLGRLLRRTPCDPRRRAVYQLIGQTLWRTQRLRLLLAFFGGLGLAMILSAVVLIRAGHGALSLAMSPSGTRIAVPVMAFCAVAGLRTVLRAPVASAGSWALRVIHGRAKEDHLTATTVWVAFSASAVTLATVIVLHWLAPPDQRPTLTVQVLMAIALPLLLTDVFFFRERTMPFTEARPYSVNDLAFVATTCLALFPVFCFSVVACEPWIEETGVHLLVAVLSIVGLHGALRWLRARVAASDAEKLDMEEDILQPGQMGLLN